MQSPPGTAAGTQVTDNFCVYTRSTAVFIPRLILSLPPLRWGCLSQVRQPQLMIDLDLLLPALQLIAQDKTHDNAYETDYQTAKQCLPESIHSKADAK